LQEWETEEPASLETGQTVDENGCFDAVWCPSFILEHQTGFPVSDRGFKNSDLITSRFYALN
jgi:hypothetical protein